MEFLARMVNRLHRHADSGPGHPAHAFQLTQPCVTQQPEKAAICADLIESCLAFRPAPGLGSLSSVEERIAVRRFSELSELEQKRTSRELRLQAASAGAADPQEHARGVGRMIDVMRLHRPRNVREEF